MRLPTISQLKMQNEALAIQWDQLNRLRIQSQTGKKLIDSSDDPFLADKIRSSENYLSQLSGYDLNLSLANKSYEQRELIANRALSLVSDAMQKVTYAQTQTLNNNDRAVIASELQGILTDFLKLSSAQDENGQYLYSGFNVNTQPYINQGSNFIYQGGAEPVQIDIGINNRVNYTESGYQVFGAIPTGNGFITTNSNQSLNTGTGLISDGAITNHSMYVPDNYTLSVVTNSSGQLAYVVTGANSGQVIPPLPATIPANAPTLVPGQSIVFNGISIVISGQPNNGDTFSISPSTNQDIFTTINNLVQLLKTPVNTPKSQADLSQQLINLGQNLKQASNHFMNYETQLGNLGAAIDDQTALAASLKLNEEQIISELSDVDQTQVLTDIIRQDTLIKLTQDIYMQLQDSLNSLIMLKG